MSLSAKEKTLPYMHEDQNSEIGTLKGKRRSGMMNMTPSLSQKIAVNGTQPY